MLSRNLTHGVRTFALIWFGQLISLTGSGLTGFALGVWTFKRTGSVTQFALIALFTTLPSVVISPFIGALVDRWNRRWVMLFSDTGAALGTLSIFLLLQSGQLEIWHIYLATTVTSIFGAFQWPAYSAATTLLVPKQHLGRASGLVQLGQAASQLLSPLLGSLLFEQFGLHTVIAIDFATYLFSVATLMLVRIPKPPTTAAGVAGKGSLWHEATYGMRYILARPGLLGLLLFFAGVNFSAGMVEILISPLILRFASESTLGLVLSIAGCGMLVGTLVMSVWGGPKRRVYGILIFSLVQGALLFLGGVRPNVPLVAAAAFIYLFCLPIIVGCSQAIWQSKVEPDVQGRVFAIRAAIAWSTLPLAYLIGGPLADNIFEPLMATGGPLAESVGHLIGTGPGRGIGLLLIVLGVFTLLATLAGYLYPRLRKLEDDLPDAIGDATPAALHAPANVDEISLEIAAAK